MKTVTKEQYSLTLWLLTERLVAYIMREKKLSFYQATKELVSSKTYKNLENSNFGLWQFGVPFIYRVFENEQDTNTFTMPEEVL